MPELNRNFENNTTIIDEDLEDEPNDGAKSFYRLLKESNQPLYDGSKCSKLSLLIKLFHIKSLGGWSNTSFTMLLQLLKEDILPSGTTFPDSYYEAKKIIDDLGLSYQKIDACINNSHLYKQDKSSIMEHMLSLARGPTTYVTCYNGYLINGYRFRIEDRDKGFKTQNCGVVVVGDTGAETEKQDYYGVLTEVIELQYVGGHRVVLFRCNWYDVYDREKGIKTDEYGIVSVNRQRLLKTNEPFVLANQASQVFYATDNINKGWHVVQKTQPRDLYEMPLQMDADSEDVQDGIDAYQEYESFPPINNLSTSLNMDNEISRNRKDIEPMMVDADKIVDATQSGPSLSNIELVEKCFGPQRHNHIICHGGGLKPNDMKTIGTRAELQAKLRETQKENDSLKSRMDEMEAEIRMIKEMFQRQHSNGPPPSSSEG
uniref:DUF4216 domain-containing protein n=1 Tax=Ananas comosus var. bracteatus TaxID=296719 RepID=A0A6V7QLV9_ANACO|nr:unnamed protein product [Ananas comosus var. bracteatus]